jgi:hypothetical protein
MRSWSGLTTPLHFFRMAQNPTPELYLSLLSGQDGISTEQHHNDVGSRISDHPFPNDPNRLMDLLDALAAVCIQKEKAEVFFVSLAMDSNAATLYVSSNETVPATVTSHLHKIRGQLKQLRAVVEPNPSIPADNETSPDPNNTQSRTDAELELQKTIYEHSYSKLCRRFSKRAPAILEKYKAMMTNLQAKEEDTDLLNLTLRKLLEHVWGLLQNERPPLGSRLIDLIQTIDVMSRGWQSHLKEVGDDAILTRWDNLICKSGLTFHETITHLLL